MRERKKNERKDIKIRTQKCTVLKDKEEKLNCYQKTRMINIKKTTFKEKNIEIKEINKWDDRKCI